MDKYGHFCKPGLLPLLKALGLDVTYERAEGDYMWHRRGTRLVPVLDLVGGYGANLFGHHHPELVAAAKRHFDAKIPVHAQASCRAGAAYLAEELCHRLGDYVVTFTNSGAETIEAAIKHCLLERPKRMFWAVQGAFHGKTLGSIQFTWSYRTPYQGFGPPVRFLDPQNPDDWEDALKEVGDVSGIFIEPIAGEGGVRPLSAQFLSWISTVSRKTGIPLVVDEIQTGMGRTGTFLASQSMGIEPDYICLSKALGGGLAKIGALLVKRERFIEEFSVKHTSTFAEDDFSCQIALDALALLDRDNLPSRCATVGKFLVEEMEGLRRQFPMQIKEIRGSGLILGIELQDHAHSHSYILRMLSKENYLGYLAASYLLNVHNIRIAPTLSQPSTLRLEPSAYVQNQDLRHFIYALGKLCEALKVEDVGHLTRFQIGSTTRPIVDCSHLRCEYKREECRTAHRVAFLGHLLLDDHLKLREPSLMDFQVEDLRIYLDKAERIIAPTICDQVNVRSRTGNETHLSFIGFGLTSRQIVRAMEKGDSKWIVEKVEAAVALARDEGCKVIGFGGYTSIVTANCLRVKTTGIALTTGNSLTVGMGLSAMRQAASEAGIDLSKARVAVVGAAGNIASTYAAMIAPEVAELLLVVRDLASPRTKRVLKDVKEAGKHTVVWTTDKIKGIADCSLILTATNTPEPLIYPYHLGRGPIVICDISLPSDVAEEVRIERPDVLVIGGGVVRLPHNDDFSIGGIPLTKGHAFACMAETLLMGLERSESHGSIGPVRPPDVIHAMAMAEKHGFVLGNIKANATSNTAMSLGYAQAHNRKRCHLRSESRSERGQADDERILVRTDSG